MTPTPFYDRLPHDLRVQLDEAADLLAWAQALDDQAWPRPPAGVVVALLEKAGDVASTAAWAWRTRRDEEAAERMQRQEAAEQAAAAEHKRRQEEEEATRALDSWNAAHAEHAEEQPPAGDDVTSA